jgi:hypothetical protein
LAALSAFAGGPDARIELRPASRFGVAALVIIWSFGLFLLAPVLLSLFAVSLIRLSSLTLLLPASVLILTAIIIPFGQANLFIRQQVHKLGTEPIDGESFVVQLTLHPRLKRGLRGMVEDADDFGRLIFRPEGLVFEGDAVTLWLPYGAIVSVQGKNVGARGRYIAGGRILLETRGLENFEGFEIADRSSLTSAQASRQARKIFGLLSGRIDAGS